MDRESLANLRAGIQNWGPDRFARELKQRFPEGLDYQIVYDTTPAVEASIESIVHTFIEALILVTLVVFIFLQNIRATIIPLITIPVSLIGTFIFFPLLGFSVNTLSMFGLVLAIGIVVDDAIVVVEAVIHHLEKGMNPREATIKAMEEVTAPVIGIALILSAVFIPVAMLGGLVGSMYKQFALTIAISVLLSAFNALSLTPALCAMLLKAPRPMRGPLGVFFRGFNKVFDVTTGGYVAASRILVRKGILTIGIVAVVAVGAAGSAAAASVGPVGLVGSVGAGAAGAAAGGTSSAADGVAGASAGVAGGISATGGSAEPSALNRKDDCPQAVAVKKTANKAMPARLVIFM